MRKYLYKHLSYSILIIAIMFGLVFLSTSLTGCGKGKDEVEEDSAEAKDGVAMPEFPVLDGWKLGKVKIYKGDELYDPINGEADRYLHYGFQEAYFGSYKQEGGEGIIDVHVYRMDDKDNAYGVYSMYDSPSLSHDVLPRDTAISGGSQEALDFAKGRYFVRISEHQMNADTELLSQVGTLLARNIEGDAISPEVISLLPEGYAEGSITYFRKHESLGEINYDFIDNVFGLSERTEGVEAAYTLREDGGKNDRLLIIRYGDEGSASGTIEGLIKFFTDEGYRVDELEEGTISVIRDGKSYAHFTAHSRYICGIYEITENRKAKQLFSQTLGKLQ